MRFAASLVAGLVLVLGATAPAQVTITPYGQPGLYQSRYDPALWLNGTQPDPTTVELRVTGGFWGDPVALLISTYPNQQPLGSGATVYVAPPAVPFWGVLDPWGEMVVRIPANVPSMADASVYFQAIEVMQTGGLSLSNGLAVAYPF